MALSKKLRFEVFKRDGFTCQYCGKSSPQVVLEVDHIIPVIEGGQDNFENLATSCFDCNRGKGKEMLENYREGMDPTDQAILLLERERQLKEYNEVVRVSRERKNQDYAEILKYWNDNIGISEYWTPTGVMRRALDFIPMERILEAVDICRTSTYKREDRSWGEAHKAFFCGIIKNMTNNYGQGE